MNTEDDEFRRIEFEAKRRAQADDDDTQEYVAQRVWVGLTDEEITELRLKTLDAVATNHEVYRAIEAKLKEKNT